MQLLKVPPDIKTEAELDQYAEILIFGIVKNIDWEFKGWDVKAFAKEGKTVRYSYSASFVLEQGGKLEGEATKPPASNPDYQTITGPEKEAINGEIDKRYWENTSIPKGEKINPGEQSKIDIWNVYRDEVMGDNKNLKDLPLELKELMGGESNFQPQDYKQLLRIADKLKQFSPEDITVYKMLALRATDNLDLFEKSVDLFLARKKELQEALKRQEQNQGQDSQTMADAIAASWQGFDSSKIGKMSQADQYDLARQQAWEVTKAQLQYMKDHPGEMVIDFAKTATLMNTGETFKGIGQDLAEAANGDANAWARWASGAGAGAKLSGWLLAVGSVLYVLSWLTGIGELATIAAFMGAMLASTIVLSQTESDLRIKAASEAKTPEEFKQQVTKAAVAQTNVIVMLGLLIVALAIRFTAKTFFPETVKNISRSLARFREKIRLVGKLSEIKAELVTEMQGYRQKLIAAGEIAKENSKIQAERLEKTSIDEFIEQLESGKGDWLQEASVQENQQVPWKQLAQTPEGLEAIKTYQAQLIEALRTQIPTEIDALVTEQVDAIDATLEKVNQATIPDEFDQALKDHEKFLSEEEVAKRGKEREQQMRKEKAEEALKEIEKEAQLREYDKFDEHDLDKLTDAERNILFDAEAEARIYRGVKMRTRDRSRDMELDRVNLRTKKIIEDKTVTGFNKNPNPKQAIERWVNKHILEGGRKKIKFITEDADHVYYDPKVKGSPHLPNITDVKAIRTIEFRLNGSMQLLENEVNAAFTTLSNCK